MKGDLSCILHSARQYARFQSWGQMREMLTSCPFTTFAVQSHYMLLPGFAYGVSGLELASACSLRSG